MSNHSPTRGPAATWGGSRGQETSPRRKGRPGLSEGGRQETSNQDPRPKAGRRTSGWRSGQRCRIRHRGYLGWRMGAAIAQPRPPTLPSPGMRRSPGSDVCRSVIVLGDVEQGSGSATLTPR